MGRNTLLQAAALDRRTLECADSRSACLQVSQKQEGQRLFTKRVPESAVWHSFRNCWCDLWPHHPS